MNLYSSQRDAVLIALAEHFVREEQREKEKKMAELYFVLIQHKEARELLKEVSRTPKKRAEALTKAGIAWLKPGDMKKQKSVLQKLRNLKISRIPIRRILDPRKRYFF